MQLICWGVPCCPVDHGPPVVLVFMFCFVVVVLFSPDDAEFPGPIDFSPFTLKFIDAMLPIHSLFVHCFGFDWSCPSRTDAIKGPCSSHCNILLSWPQVVVHPGPFAEDLPWSVLLHCCSSNPCFPSVQVLFLLGPTLEIHNCPCPHHSCIWVLELCLQH